MKNSFLRTLLFLLIGIIVGFSWSFSRSGFIDSIFFKPLVITVVFYFLGFFIRLLGDRITKFDRMLVLLPTIILIGATYFTFKKMFLHDLILLPFGAIIAFFIGYKVSKLNLAINIFSPFIVAAIMCLTYYYTIPKWDYLLIEKPKEFPNFYTTNISHTFLDKDSNVVKLNEFKNKVILIDFYNNGCRPCIEQLPFLKQVQENIQNELFEILLINTGNADSYSSVFTNKHFANKGLKVLLDYKSEFSNFLHIEAVPRQFLIDKNGEVIFYKEGATFTESESYKYKNLEKLIQLALNN